MAIIEYLTHVAGLTMAGMIQAWPITSVLILAVILSIANNSPFTRRDYKRSYLLMLLPAVLTFLVMLFSSPSGAIAGVILVIVQLPTNALLARRFWQYQGIVLTSGAFLLWVSMVAIYMTSPFRLLSFHSLSD